MLANTMTGTASQELTREIVFDRLVTIKNKMRRLVEQYRPMVEKVHPNFTKSAENLLHYLAFRSNEIRDIQIYLHEIGLSSLTISESHALFQVLNVLQWLNPEEKQDFEGVCSFEEANKLRLHFSEDVFGETEILGKPHVMVTLGTHLATDLPLMEEMLVAGMTVARINCAHDDSTVWTGMVNTLKEACARTGMPCKLYVDLAGPKIRIKAIWQNGINLSSVAVIEEEELTLTSSWPSTSLRGIVLFVEPKEIIEIAQVGERIFFDDGKFEATIIRKEPDRLRIRLERIFAKKPKLKVGKGINLPDSRLETEALTEEDVHHLPFICQYADMVGYSFVSQPSDIDRLRQELSRQDSTHHPTIILKIERFAAMQNLPALLLQGMKDRSLGVMIARGDLAVEIGFERMSEIQQEILWICEAAHVPVIWATQVLERMNKTGFATRSEISDAAMSVGAECVMLNKGKHLPRTIRSLNDILVRQLGHYDKKRYILRPLGIAKNFVEGKSEWIF